MSEFQKAAGPTTGHSNPLIIATVIRKIREQVFCSYDELAKSFGFKRQDVRAIVTNEPGIYYDPHYEPISNEEYIQHFGPQQSNLTHNHPTQEDGWVIGENSWRFCRNLYSTYGIILGFGEFRSIVRQIKFGEAEYIESRPYSSVFRVKLPQHADESIYVVANRDGLPVKVLPHSSFAIRQSRHMSQIKNAANL